MGETKSACRRREPGMPGAATSAKVTVQVTTTRTGVTRREAPLLHAIRDRHGRHRRPGSAGGSPSARISTSDLVGESLQDNPFFAPDRVRHFAEDMFCRGEDRSLLHDRLMHIVVSVCLLGRQLRLSGP